MEGGSRTKLRGQAINLITSLALDTHQGVECPFGGISSPAFGHRPITVKMTEHWQRIGKNGFFGFNLNIGGKRFIARLIRATTPLPCLRRNIRISRFVTLFKYFPHTKLRNASAAAPFRASFRRSLTSRAKVILTQPLNLSRSRPVPLAMVFIRVSHFSGGQ